MNKLYSQIVSLVVIVGLGTVWAFGVIDATLFTTISVTVLSAIFALYQKYEKDEVVKTNLQLEDALSSYKTKNNKLEVLVSDRNLIIKTLAEEANKQTILTVNNEIEKPKKVRKPKIK